MQYDVCVVGAGLAGAASARELAARGHSVLLLEQHAVGHRHGSSHGSSRIYRRAYADPFYVALTGRAADEWDRLEDESGVALRTPTGGLDVGAGRPEAVHAALTSAGVPVVHLSTAEVADRWPGIAVGPATFHPGAGHLDADRTVSTCVELAARHGAELREHTAMTRLEPAGDGVVVHTEGGSDRARRVVVAAGAWLPELLGGLGVSPQLPDLQVKQQEVFHHRHRDPAAAWPTLVHLTDDTEIYALPSGRDGGPAPAYKVGQFDSESDTSATARDGVIDDLARRTVRAFVEEYLPGLEPEPVAEASCLFTMTPDGDFVLDRVGPVVVASPCSGHAAKFAPLTGVLVADLVEGGTPDPRFAFRSAPAGTASWA
ncbi:FAD-dependent oxidoreductase [Nocardioides sp. MAH-18]|uniref:FAD-dependent oxidoreductase n=1 Tax=Nocardioides agri TaxID=2682843 RepID=A0A6L6Y1U7_9ACTN|nr:MULTISPECIES: FAD-dependent oxidoreductase [unclassified Nocardioides]MBA2952394.1 FAD-dependent oxidoreductase [Nocardioides sp. CGMCC 1.13656]MVQ51555.1 FAD-dependent oxidoreductase [Nocardioides sp. MAH-18]